MDRLAEAVRDLARATFSPYDLDGLLDRLVRNVTAVIDADGAEVMLEDGERNLGFATASCQGTLELGRFQQLAGSGPCHEAFLVGRTVVVEDLEEIDWWTGYRDRARECGFRSMVAVPLHAQGEIVGVLGVYRESPWRWSDEELGACEILGSMAAGHLLHARRMRASHRLTGQLREVLESRAIIERAKGLLMVRAGVDADTAFRQLWQSSMDANRKLRDVAHELVVEHTHSVSDPSPDDNEQIGLPAASQRDPLEVVVLDDATPGS